MYVATGLGVTVGFHRLLTHRSFQTVGWVRAVFAVLGSMSVQGPVIHWVSDHRKHHAFTDEEGDPHSPHVGAGRGLRRALAGLWHAHVGWLFSAARRAAPQRYARDLVADPPTRGINRLFPGRVALGLAIPFAIGHAATGRRPRRPTRLPSRGPV